MVIVILRKRHRVLRVPFSTYVPYGSPKGRVKMTRAKDILFGRLASVQGGQRGVTANPLNAMPLDSVTV